MSDIQDAAPVPEEVMELLVEARTTGGHVLAAPLGQGRDFSAPHGVFGA